MNLKHFQEALRALGKNDRERAARLGVGLRTVTRYKTWRRDEMPDPVAHLMNVPSLLEALVIDAQTPCDCQQSADQAA